MARAAGAPHRALLDLHGVPMLERVLRSLERSSRVESIRVSIDEPALLEEFAGLRELRLQGTFEVCASATSPSRSVLAVMEMAPESTPLLVTTADHPLLSPEMVEQFLSSAEASRSDAAVGLVAASTIRARFPDSVRTYLRFGGEGYSGANLFVFRTAASRRVLDFWKRAENLRKRPWRLISLFGPAALVLFALGRIGLGPAFERASRVIGARVVPVVLPFAEAAVDVDRMSDLELVRRLLEEARPAKSV